MLNITPKGKQREVLALPSKGHTVVLGTAGSGKTTIALLRAHHLSCLPGNERVLLVTFNGALVEYMKEISASPSSKIVVENYHKFARGYLNSRAKMPAWNGILDSDKKAAYIEQAVDHCRKIYPTESTFKRPVSFFVEEITFIQHFGFNNFEEYYKSERIGRATANIKRENRKWIFEVYKKYIELRKAAGREYDWDDLAFFAYKELQQDDSPRRYTHIIIDEGQDFSPMMIKSLVCAVAPGGSFTFFGDVAQQIYGSRLSWRDSGIETDKVWWFDANYRNPETITKFAGDITKSPYWRHDSDMIEASHSIAEGPKPILVKFGTEAKEISWVVERAAAAATTSSAVIVCRTRADIDVFAQAFRAAGCHTTEINKDTPGFAHVKDIYLTTFHAAKGLEFEHVFVPFLNENKLPDPESVAQASSKEDAYADEIKLLYVAATRSKYALYMTYNSTLTPLFPQNVLSVDYYSEEDLL